MLFSAYMLLPIAIAVGWCSAKMTAHQENDRDNDKLHHDYFRGLNYLLHEKQDEAVDVFINMSGTDADTVEMHLALGCLFRRRGEVDRAIRIHQNLIARPQLSKTNRLSALLALGEDYLRAGVLDRAEKIFLELISLGERKKTPYLFLLEIYQQEKEWEKAIDVVKKIRDLKHELPISVMLAQFYCEQAEIAKTQCQLDIAKRLLKKAKRSDSGCVRASMLLGDMAFESSHFSAAIAYYQEVIDKDVAYITEVIKPLFASYQRSKNTGAIRSFFKKIMACDSLGYTATIEIANWISLHDGDDKAVDFLKKKIKNSPSIEAVVVLLSLYKKQAGDAYAAQFSVLENLMQTFLNDKLCYQCSHCGFSTQSLLWYCPGCHQWATIKPLETVKGRTVK